MPPVSPAPSAARFEPRSLIFPGLLALAVLLLYGQGIHNALFFDDARLSDGTIFGQYGSLATFKARMLSYGSFVWLQGLFGEGWWKHRVGNILLHLGTCLAIYSLLRQLMVRTEFPADMRESSHFEASRTAALQVGMLVFALNPVAVYAVAYLIQRSIVMATLLVALAAWSFVRGLLAIARPAGLSIPASGQASPTRHAIAWFALALVCYVAAVLSKEYAITAIALTVPLYVFVARPGLKRILALSAVALVLMLGAGALLYGTYGGIIGTVFDENSKAYALQLEKLSPGVGARLYPLSIFNQAAQFFHYGALWLLPNVQWMSIDIRPAFPLSFTSWPQLAGALGFVLLLGVSGWLVVRKSDAWGLAGLCLLCPALLFLTEFSTVWLQDPFVLYRSYLWALTLPALVALPLVGFKARTLYPAGLLVAALLAALSFERIQSLQDAQSAWADAAAKVNLKADASAVGRWRPILNLGSENLERGNNEIAYRHFVQADALGEPLGTARFNMGMSLQQLKQHPRALADFERAEALGFTEPALYYHRGESLYALGRFAEAFQSFGMALSKPQDADAAQFTRLRHAEAAVAIQNFDAAIQGYQALLKASPDNQRYQVGLSMALIGKKDISAALALLNPAIDKKPTGSAHYARALAYFFAGDKTASAKDLDIAIRAEPGNPLYPNLKRQLEGPSTPPIPTTPKASPQQPPPQPAQASAKPAAR